MTLYKGSRQVKPMKYCGSCSDGKKERALHDNNYILQEKVDGAWYQLERTDDGEIYLFGRTESKVTGEYTEKIANVPWLKDWAQLLPNGTTLVGEIYIPGGHSNDVTKIMGCLPEKAIERQKKVHVQYMVFDCIRYDGKDLCKEDFSVRFNYVEYYLGDLFSSSCSFDGYREEDPHVKIVNTWTLDGSLGEQVDSYPDVLNNIFKAGGEGAVLKHRECPYRPGMRTTMSQGFKIKEHVDSVDLVVMDLLDPEMEYTGKELESWPYYYSKTSKKKYYCENKEDYFIDDSNVIPITKHYYYGWKNAMKVGAYDDEGKLREVGRVASGLTDELRENLSTNPDDYLGRVVQLSCMSLDKQEKTLRHPVFECFRDDKDAFDCKLNEIFAKE